MTSPPQPARRVARQIARQVARQVVCVDVGSTFTKAAVVDLDDGAPGTGLLARTEHPTTVATDVLDGVSGCLDELAKAVPNVRDLELRACSSAGGGLRIAVLGNEELVTAEAGRRVALSSGGRVVHVASGVPGAPELAELRESRPDVLLLTGGTDGGNAEVLLASAGALADARWPGPVVVAGNADAAAEVAQLLEGAGTPTAVASNVVPRIGVLAPEPARRAIRRVFLEHVIGGKHLSRSDRFATLVRGATPDVVLTAVELLARGTERRDGVGDVVVVDVGGATTDVYSVVEPSEDEQPDAEGLARDVVGRSAVTRTVEGDLGMRWSAAHTVEAAAALDLIEEGDLPRLEAAALRRQQDPAYLPDSPEEQALDVRLASLAAGVALRRHAGRAQVRFASGPYGGTRLVERSGTDLRETVLLVGSGGVLRHTGSAAAHLLDDLSTAGGWQVPERPRVVVDRDYVLAAAGLLADDWPDAAYRLLGALR